MYEVEFLIINCVCMCMCVCTCFKLCGHISESHWKHGNHTHAASSHGDNDDTDHYDCMEFLGSAARTGYNPTASLIVAPFPVKTT